MASCSLSFFCPAHIKAAGFCFYSSKIGTGKTSCCIISNCLFEPNQIGILAASIVDSSKIYDDPEKPSDISIIFPGIKSPN